MECWGKGWFNIAIVDSANSETLKLFLDRVRDGMGKVAVAMDNVSYRDSKTTADCENGSDGGLVRIFLPKYTPRLNPMEILWMDLKRALAGSYFDSIDELKAAITEIVRSGEMHPTKLMSYMLPDGVREPGHVPCKIWDMMSEECSAKTAVA